MALLLLGCDFGTNGSKESKVPDPADTTITIDTTTVPDTIPDTVVVIDTTTAVPDTIIPGKDAVLHHPDSLKCIVGQVHDLSDSVRIEPDTLHQSVAFIVDNAAIARASAEHVTCRKAGTAFFRLMWTNGYVSREDTLWVVVTAPLE